MMKNNKWHSNMPPHSKAKVDLLNKYLERYLPIISNSPVKNIYLFDVFCGPGRYDDGNVGSPLVMLDNVKKVLLRADNSKFYNICYNDDDGGYINCLRSIIGDDIGHRQLHIEFYCKKYAEIIPEIVQRVNKLGNSDKAFIFIDPWGYSGIRFQEIKEMLFSNKSEVLLFLPIQFMYRFEAYSTPNSLKRFIEEVLPYDQWMKNASVFDFIDKLLSGFNEGLGESYYVDTFLIQRETSHYYCLFFFTSHILGFEKMLEAKWEIDEKEGRGWRYNEDQDLFSSFDAKHSATIQFENELRSFLAGVRSNQEVYKFVLHRRHLPKHANELLKNWQNKGILSVIDVNGISVKKGAFYLAYKDWKKEQKKVSIQILK